MARETFPHSYTSPYIHLWIFKTYELLFFEFEFWPTPPHPYMTHPTPSWPTPPHPYMTHPTPSWPTPPLHDPPTPPHPTPYMTHPTPSWPTPPHPTPSWPTPPHPFMTHPPHPTPPHPWYIFGHKGAFFHGLLHYVSLSVDNKILLF